MNKILLSIPNLKGNEKKYLLDCIDTNFVSSVGQYVDKFEEAFAAYHKSPGAVAVVNGTAALHISLQLAGVQTNDEVIVPNLTFIAPANAVKYLGAHPVLVDSSWETLGMCPVKLKQLLESDYKLVDGVCQNRKTERPLRALVVMHTFGNLVDIESILNIAEEFHLKVVEDACEALGASINGQKAGTFGDFGCFSFNGNKIITSGGGGMILAKNHDDLKKAKHLTTTAKINSLFFEHDEVGFNYRMVNILAALGLAQFELSLIHI